MARWSFPGVPCASLHPSVWEDGDPFKHSIRPQVPLSQEGLTGYFSRHVRAGDKNVFVATPLCVKHVPAGLCAAGCLTKGLS